MADQQISKEKEREIKELIGLIKNTPHGKVLAKEENEYHAATIVGFDVHDPLRICIEWDWKTNRKQKYDYVLCNEIIYPLLYRSSRRTRRSAKHTSTNLDEALAELPSLRGRSTILDQEKKKKVRELIELRKHTKVLAKHHNRYYEATIISCDDEDPSKVKIQWNWNTQTHRRYDVVPCNQIIYPLLHTPRRSRSSTKTSDTNLDEALQELPEPRKKARSSNLPQFTPARTAVPTNTSVAALPTLDTPTKFWFSDCQMVLKDREQPVAEDAVPTQPAKMMGSLPEGCDELAIFDESVHPGKKAPPQKQRNVSTASVATEERDDALIGNIQPQMVVYDDDDEDKKLPAAFGRQREQYSMGDGSIEFALASTNELSPSHISEIWFPTRNGRKGTRQSPYSGADCHQEEPSMEQESLLRKALAEVARLKRDFEALRKLCEQSIGTATAGALDSADSGTQPSSL